MSNNNRLARGAKVLRDQVLTRFPDAEWNGDGEPDGLGVIRGIWFEGEAAKFIAKALPETEDRRIASVDRGSKGRVVVTFVNTNVADQVEEFPLDAAAAVAGYKPPAPEKKTDDE